MSRPENCFLESLSSESRQSLLAACTAVVLPRNTVLMHPNTPAKYAYFLNSGVCSLITTISDGESAEIGVIGNEGVVNALSILGPAKIAMQGVVQVDATAYQMPLRELRRKFDASEEIRNRLLELIQRGALAANQIAGCHRLHGTEQRLARWLLMVRDRVDSDDLNMTQSFLGMLLGAQRPTVTLVARAMQARGLLELRRGKIMIADRQKLEAAACECYQVIRSLYPQFQRS